MRPLPLSLLLWAAASLLLGACDDGDSDDEAPHASARRLDLFDDASQIQDLPGAYEWWNFFAVDEQQDISVSMIFNVADPFNCDYRQAAADHLEDPSASALSPFDYPLLQLQVKVGEEAIFEALRNRPDITVEFSRQTGKGRIGESTFEGAMVDGVKTYSIHIDAPDSTADLRMIADIEISERSPGFTVDGDGLYGGIPGGAAHAWQFPLGWPRSTGSVRVETRGGETVLDTEIDGGGYTDHMWGDGNLGDILESWHFGIIEAGADGMLVSIWLTPASSDVAPYGYLFHEAPGLLADIHPIAALVGSEPLTGTWGLDYFSVITLELASGGTVRAAVDPESLAADWPFQIAGPSTADVDIPGVLEATGLPATSEYLWQPGIDDPDYKSMFEFIRDMEWVE